MEINLIIEGQFTGCPDADWFQHVVAQVLDAQDAAGNAEIGLVITDQEKVRELNRDYRGEDRPTDVLAFYMTTAGEQPESESARFVPPPDGMRHLGEVVISYPQAVIQAQEHRHSVEKELAILIIHGVLHLLGYDHENTQQKQEMSAREQIILSKIMLEQESEQ
ncbi:MAG: rRNA maturation RNase YbeY [Chloroflexota bacterium]|nr:rRNA maturation RNase YbeY [Chloroflexota bacterium]